MASDKAFKVIIAGGGPVGLTAAHALSRAGIDFVLLEKRPTVVVEAGCDLVMLPMGVRVLSQLGLYDSLCRIGAPLGEMTRIDHYGRSLGTSKMIEHIGNNHGYRAMAMSRRLLTQALFDGLSPDIQARLFPNKQLADIITTADGVEVKCTDGTSYQGSMVIGADGAHSVTRQCLSKLAQDAGGEEVNEEQPFLTTFRGMWLRFPTSITGRKAGASAETHGQLATTQLFVGDKTSVVGIYERLDQPTRERVRYTVSDEEALIERWGHIPITDCLTLGQAYASSIERGMTNLEEGVLKQWHHDRIVLVGDAAHKYTPSTGQGCNVGIIDVVVLVNKLHKTLEEARSEGGPEVLPSTDSLRSTFAEYQSRRYNSVVAGCERAGKATANATWETTSLWLLDRFVLSWHSVQKYFADGAAQAIAKTPILDFIDFDDPVEGKVPWVHPARRSPLAAQ